MEYLGLSETGCFICGEAKVMVQLGCVMTFVRYREDQWLAVKL